ncbi:hypothetical protein [Azospirillum halopraeferens]|uniref:hypothetical protein n=1 Tax=Azospirillum halopraeferens TaxID=34010 RepID=UPI0004124067|nr:hypothetical protein [Azospirillum halopraeferens]
MNALDHCLQRIALLDRADEILNQMRVYDTGLPVREAMARHRATLNEARRHLDSARALMGR